MMNVRKLAMTVALATASVFALASPASAQSFGGITLSFGSGGYNSYSYDDDDDNHPASSYYTYGVPQYQTYSYYSRPSYEWQERARLEQWRAAQQRRLYWEHERHEHQHWRDDDDDN